MGEIDRVDATPLRNLIEAGYIPILDGCEPHALLQALFTTQGAGSMIIREEKERSSWQLQHYFPALMLVVCANQVSRKRLGFDPRDSILMKKYL